MTTDDDVRGGNSDEPSLGTSDEHKDKRMHPEKKQSKTDLLQWALSHTS